MQKTTYTCDRCNEEVHCDTSGDLDQLWKVRVLYANGVEPTTMGGSTHDTPIVDLCRPCLVDVGLVIHRALGDNRPTPPELTAAEQLEELIRCITREEIENG